MNSFCVLDLQYDGRQFHKTYYKEHCESTAFTDIKITTINHITYIIALFKSLDGTNNMSISLYSLCKENADSPFHRHFANPVQTTCNGAYPVIHNNYPSIILTRKQGLDVLTFSDGCSYMKITPSSLTENALLGTPLITPTVALFPSDYGGIFHYQSGSLKRVCFNEGVPDSLSSSARVYRELYDLGDQILLRDEGNALFLTPAKQLYSYERAHVPLHHLSYTITPCSQICSLSNPSGLEGLAILTGRRDGKKVVEGWYGVKIKLGEKIPVSDRMENQEVQAMNKPLNGEHGVDVFAFAKHGHTYICKATTMSSSLWVLNLREKTMDFVSNSFLPTYATTLACGLVQYRLIQVTTNAVYWIAEGIWKSISMEKEQTITHAFLGKEDLYLIMNQKDVMHGSVHRESLSLTPILSSDLPIVHSILLPHGGIAYTTTDGLTVIQSSLSSSSSNPSSFSIPFMNPIQSIAALSAFHQSLLLLIDNTATLFYYLIQPTGLSLLTSIPVGKDAVLSSIQLYQTQAVLLRQSSSVSIILPSCPFQFTPFFFPLPEFRNAYQNQPSSIINHPNNKSTYSILSTETAMFVWVQQELFIAVCHFKDSALTVQAENPFASASAIHAVNSGMISLSPLSSSSCPRCIKANDYGDVALKMLMDTPIDAITAITLLENNILLIARNRELIVNPGMNGRPLTFQLNEVCTGLKQLSNGMIVAVLRQRIVVLVYENFELREITSMMVRDKHDNFCIT